jgi:hypothetical protein
MGDSSSEYDGITDPVYSIGIWSDIKRNLYLTTSGTRKEIEAYLEIKIGKKTWSGGKQIPDI